MLATHAIVCRETSLIVSRHPDRESARAAWRREGTAPAPCGLTVTRWGAQHSGCPIATATRLLARREGARTIRVTPVSHPAVHNALACMSRDAGETERYKYVVPKPFTPHIASAETSLRTLDADASEAILFGGREAARIICKGDRNLMLTRLFVGAFFRDWHRKPHKKASLG